MNTQLNEQLCPKCATGAASYRLDPLSAECPYLVYHNGEQCPFFMPFTESEVTDDEKV